jgi:2'-phosphotransferase
MGNGTCFKSWPAIKETGLSRMKRQHVHFACGELGDKEVISDIRKTCEICMNVPKMLEDRVSLFEC